MVTYTQKGETMRYYIAHLVKDPAAQYHHNIVGDVAARFGLKSSKGYFPSHITLKAPFESGDATAVKNVLGKFARTHCAQPFTLCGFGRFQKNVVFLDVGLLPKTSRLIKDLQSAIISAAGMQWGAHEPLENLHITIAKKDIAEKFDSIWAYLCEKEPPQFNLLFDNIALLRLENDTWVVDSVYTLNP